MKRPQPRISTASGQHIHSKRKEKHPLADVDSSQWVGHLVRRSLWQRFGSHPRRSNNDFGTPATPALQAGAATFQEFIASPKLSRARLPISFRCIFKLESIAPRPALVVAPLWDSVYPAREHQWATCINSGSCILCLLELKREGLKQMFMTHLFPLYGLVLEHCGS